MRTGNDSRFKWLRYIQLLGTSDIDKGCLKLIMSSANGTVTFENGDVFFFEYYATNSRCVPNLYLSKEEMKSHWRDHSELPPLPEVIPDEEEVEIFVDYGNGRTWSGTASRSLMRIVQKIESNENKPILEPTDCQECLGSGYHDGFGAPPCNECDSTGKRTLKADFRKIPEDQKKIEF